MKYPILSVLLLVIALVGVGCGRAPTTGVDNASPEPAAAEDKDSLIAALESAGAMVEAGESVEQDFFIPVGQVIKVDDADVQVFEYESVEAMENEASQVAPDGGSIGTTMVTWIDTPHFYKGSRIIVLYVGSDETILTLLEQVLGTQFAGR